MALYYGFDSDWRPQSDGSYSYEQIYNILYDLREEPNWRERAAEEAAYYDGNQLDVETLQRMEELNLPDLIINLIQPAINSVMGYEALTRSDPIVLAENDESVEGAEALNAKLKEATRRTHFNREVARAFKDQITIGIGWLEVSRGNDPTDYDYRCKRAPWREMFWDWRAREDDLSDSRYFVRRMWQDGDIAATLFPEHAELIRSAVRGWPSTVLSTWEQLEDTSASQLAHAYHHERNVSLEDREWRDVNRRRVAIYEILYRVPHRLRVLALPDGRRVEFDERDPVQVALLQGGHVTLKEGVTKLLRQAYYIGPHRMYDRQLPYRDPHYIPFIAYRQDNDGSVYGIVRSQKSPQDAVNAHRSRLTYDTLSNRAVVDEDAVDDHEEAAQEIGRPDMYLVQKTERRRDKAVEILDPPKDTGITMELLQESKRNISDTTGLFPEFHGKQSSSGQSGIALETLISQGQQVLGPIYTNYRTGREAGARRLLELIITDLVFEQNVSVAAMSEDVAGQRTSKTIVLNARAHDGGPMTNRLSRMRTRLALEEAPSSPTYLAQKFQSLTEMVKSFPPEIQVALLPLVVAASQIPHRKEILATIRDVTGMGPPPEDPQERQAYEQAKQREQQIAQRMQEIELMEREAEAKTKMANAELTMVKARKLEGADTEHTEAKTAHELAKIELAMQEAERQDVDQQANLMKTGAELKALARKPEGESAARQR